MKVDNKKKTKDYKDWSTNFRWKFNQNKRFDIQSDDLHDYTTCS